MGNTKTKKQKFKSEDKRRGSGGVPKPMSIDELRRYPTVSLLDAAAALGLGRTLTYEMVRKNEFPCKVIRVGGTYRVPVPGLLELLGAG